MKENVDIKKEKKLKEKNIFHKNKKIILMLLCLVVILIIVIGVNAVMQSMEYKKYEHYEEKMNSYGFNRLYDNESAKTSEKVTKSEAVKMAIATCLNTFEIEGVAKEPTEDYENAIWVLYAQDMKIANATDLNKDTESQKVEYIKVIEYFANAKKEILKKDLTIDDKQNLTDMDKYTVEQKSAIIDLLSNDILKIVEDKLNGKKSIFKGQLNEIVVNYIEKYNLFGDKIQTDVTKLPSNASDFAYISQDVAKEVYEIPYIVNYQSDFKMPYVCFSDVKKYYTQMISKVEDYYNTILNVDYISIENKSFTDSIKNLVVSMTNTSDYEEYINYVKANQIKIVGNAKAQKPILYFDGDNYRLRVKLEFKIENSLTNENLLFYDLASDKKIKYEKKEYSVFADVVLSSVYGSGTFYTKTTTLDTIISGDNNPGIYENTQSK